MIRRIDGVWDVLAAAVLAFAAAAAVVAMLAVHAMRCLLAGLLLLIFIAMG